MTRFSQNAVVDKLNAYLKSRHRDLVLEYGYCHGLSLLWLYKMSEGKEKWFYDTVQKIVTAKTPADFDDLEMDFEKFIAHIEWLQNPSAYAPQIQQLDLDSVLEIPNRTPLSSVLNPRQFDDIIDLIAKPNQMICLSCPNHTIGLYERGKNYFLYDSNYEDCNAHSFTDKKLLTHEVVDRLFKNLHISTMAIALQINVVTPPEEKIIAKNIINKTEFLHQVANTSDQVNREDDFGMTSLYLASENHDPETATHLLARGALVNQQRHDGETPLLAATVRGYADMAGLFLQHGAQANLADNKGLSPLYIAVDNNSTGVIRILLDHGANPLQATKDHWTPLTIAINNKNWTALLMMLPYIKPNDAALLAQRDTLRLSQQEIQQTGKDMTKALPANAKKQMISLLKQLFDETPSQEQAMELTGDQHRLFPARRGTKRKMPGDNTPRPDLQHFMSND